MKTRLRSVLPAILFALLPFAALAAPAPGSYCISFMHHGIKWHYTDSEYPGACGLSLADGDASGEIDVPTTFSLDDATWEWGESDSSYWSLGYVNCIAEDAFKNCDGLVAVTIPSTVTKIGADAFAGCTSLERVLLPDGFQDKDVGLPEGVTAEYYDTDDVVVATSSLPEATEAVYFDVWIEAVGGTEPYSWDWSGSLPWDVYLSEDGELYGTPWETGEFEFVATVTDADGATAERSFTLVVGENPDNRPVIESWTPEATRFRVDPGSSVAFSVVASDEDGDDLNYYWSVYDENDDSVTNDHSAGASFVFDTGTAAEGSRYSVQCNVSDGTFYASDNPSWTILVQEKTPLAIATDATLPDALTEKSYWQPVEATGGEWPYTWEIVDPDEWPEWLGSYYIEYWEDSGYDHPYLSSDGYPTEDEIGTYSFSLRVTDSDGSNVVKQFTLEVKDNPNPPPAIDSFGADKSHAEPGESLAFSVEAHDRKGDELTFRWSWADWDSEADDWVYHDGGTGTTFAFSSETEGEFYVRVVVSDGVNECWDEQYVTVSIPKTVYVDIASTADDPDGTSWETAYPTLAEAADDANEGDTVLVAPGTYAEADVYFRAGVTLRSRDGAATTVLDGEGSHLCVNGNEGGFFLDGFTLRNGSNGENWYPAAVQRGSRLENCVVENCVATRWEGVLHECELVNCIVRNCRTTDDAYNGVIHECELVNCLVAGNACDDTWEESSTICNSRLWNCTVANNTTTFFGAVSESCSAWNCILWNNPEGDGRDNTFGASTGGWDEAAGGYTEFWIPAFTNCCVSGLEREADWLAGEGFLVDFAAQGCIEADPKFVAAAGGDFRLRAGSPCVDAGAAAFVRGETDVAGNARVQGTAVDLGAYEGAVEGFVVSVRVVGAGAVSPMAAVVEAGGSATFSVDASAGRPFLGWTADGVDAGNAATYTWENVQADGELAATFGTLAFFVDAATGDDANDGLSWTSPMATVRAAVEAAADGETVSVKPGVYGPIDSAGKDIRIESTDGAAATVIDGGGTNRCAYLGAGTGRGSTLSGFTLRNGCASWQISPRAGYGGGAHGGMLLDCDVFGNEAHLEGGGIAYAEARRCRIYGNSIEDGRNWGRNAYGGGAADAVLYNCLVTGNSISLALDTDDTEVTAIGGGCAWCTLYQCTVAGNSVEITGDRTGVETEIDGGGVWNGAVGAGNVVYGNTADGEPSDANGWDGPSDATGSLVGVDPKFVDAANGDYRLLEDSPAVDVGATDVEEWRDSSTTDTDLDGNPRVRGRCIDLGCHESAWTVDRTETVTTPDPVPYAWLDGYRLDTSAGYEIAAGAVASNEVNTVWQCYVAGLVPTNAASKFEARISFDGAGDPVVTWTPDLGAARGYAVEGAKKLGEDWDELEKDADWDADGYRFFRVKVSLP